MESQPLVDELKLIRIAIESLNPDPTQTIAQHRRNQTLNRGLAVYAAAIASLVAVIQAWSFIAAN